MPTSFACNFFDRKFFCIFLNRFQISVKFWVALLPMFKFCEERKFLLAHWCPSLPLILAFLWTFKALLARNCSKILKKHVWQKCLRIAFYTYIHVNLYKYLKKYHNRCTLLYMRYQGRRIIFYIISVHAFKDILITAAARISVT